IALAFIAAFVTHDSDKIYQSALDTERSNDKTLSRIERKYNKLVDKAAKRFGPKLTNVALAYGAQNAQVVSVKRSRNLPLGDEDRLELHTLDTLLAEARSELGSKPRRPVTEDKKEEATEPQKVKFARR